MPFLTAEPTLLPAGSAPASTRLRWDAGERTGAVLVLEADPPTLIASRSSGEKDLPWILPGHDYTFALRDDCETLCRVTVTRKALTPQQYAVSLLEPDAYARAVAVEQQAWGRALSDERRADRLAADAEAAARLGVGQDQLSLLDVLNELDFKPDRCLSIGCGEGRLERSMVNQGICRRFDAVDVSQDALRVASDRASAIGMDARYWQADLNHAALPKRRYDLVVAQTSLHHILRLEHLIGQIAEALKPHGYLWVHDYIGEAQFQFAPERLRIANAVLDALPGDLRWNALDERPLEQIVRRPPGTLASPFESIRSDEVVPVLMQSFEIVRSRESDAILGLVSPPGTRVAYDRTAHNRCLYALLRNLDAALIATGSLTPRQGRYLLRLRRDDVREASDA